MDSTDVQVVQEQINYHRAELLERMKNFSALWRSLVVGIAAVAALSDKVDFEIMILLALPLLALVIGYWLNEQGSLQLVSAHIALAERRLNSLVGKSLLTYESDRTLRRG